MALLKKIFGFLKKNPQRVESQMQHDASSSTADPQRHLDSHLRSLWALEAKWPKFREVREARWKEIEEELDHEKLEVDENPSETPDLNPMDKYIRDPVFHHPTQDGVAAKTNKDRTPDFETGMKSQNDKGPEDGRVLRNRTTTHAIIDHEHKLVVATFHFPTGWEAQSEVHWNLQQYDVPVKVSSRTFDPNGASTVEFFPTEAFCWIEPEIDLGKPGSDTGGGLVLLEPMPATAAIVEWIIPKYRSEVSGLRVLKTSPEMGSMIQMELRHWSSVRGIRDGGFVTIEYLDQGRVIEEQFCGLLVIGEGIKSDGPLGPIVQYNWGFERLFSFRTEKGQRHEMGTQLWDIARSFRVNQQWIKFHTETVAQIQQQLNAYLQAGYDQIAAASALSQKISANNEAMIRGMQQQRESARIADQQRRAQELALSDYSSNDAFCDYIMGQETYDDPYWSGGSKHSGYHDYVWTDGQGNYQYSNDAGFDPNIGATSQWELIKKKAVG